MLTQIVARDRGLLAATFPGWELTSVAGVCCILRNFPQPETVDDYAPGWHVRILCSVRVDGFGYEPVNPGRAFKRRADAITAAEASIAGVV